MVSVIGLVIIMISVKTNMHLAKNILKGKKMSSEELKKQAREELKESSSKKKEIASGGGFIKDKWVETTASQPNRSRMMKTRKEMAKKMKHSKNYEKGRGVEFRDQIRRDYPDKTDLDFRGM